MLTIDSHIREDKSFSTTVHISSFLFFLYAYDEEFGYNNYNNFALIQYERLHTDDEVANIEKNDQDYNYNQCKRIWFNIFLNSEDSIK